MIITKCDIDDSGNRIYTSSKKFIVKMKGFSDKSGLKDGFGFLRAVCDKNGNLLAYVRVMSIVPDVIHCPFHAGQWYAFESYNRELIKDFEIKSYNSIGARGYWNYNAATNLYILTIPTFEGVIEHWFKVQDNQITTEYGLHGANKTYTFKTETKVPDPKVVKHINMFLVDDGKKTKYRALCENLKSKIISCKIFSK